MPKQADAKAAPARMPFPSVRYCKICTHPNTRPRISFNEEGICNGCLRTMEKKEEIDWRAKEQELKDLISDALARSPKRAYDCIVPVSGGKDSTFQAWYATEKLGLRALCVNNAPFLPTPVGVANLRNLAERLPVDLISLVPNQKVFAKLSRIFLERYGDPLLHNIYLLFSGIARTALEKRIPLIFYGENGDREYGGSSAPEFIELNNRGVHARIKSDKFDFKTPERWTDLGFTREEIAIYQEPSDQELAAAGVNRLFLSDYLPWNNNYHLHVALNVVGGFQTQEERSPGTYTFGYSTDNELYDAYIWMLWPKFGFGRTTKYTSKDIQEGKIGRDQAIELVRDYDGEFPWRAFERYVEKTGMSWDDLWNAIEPFVGDEENLQREAARTGQPMKIPAWEKIGPRRWRHRSTLHGEERIFELPIPRPLSNR